jgi:NADH-quinone oxidoreductase subunit J
MQVIVYAGAIMVLFLFVIMLLNLRKDEFGRDSHIIQKYLGMALVAAILVQGVLIVSWAMKDYSASMQVVAPSGISPVPGDSLPAPIDYNSAHSVATTLFAKYAFPFEVTSILLLAAMIGAVVIARRRKLSDTESEES